LECQFFGVLPVFGAQKPAAHRKCGVDNMLY
jgi:hypothetical protein